MRQHIKPTVHSSLSHTTTCPPMPGPGAAGAIPCGEEIRSLRERARLSQAVFARYLNLTTGSVSQLERGTKRPTGQHSHHSM